MTTSVELVERLRRLEGELDHPRDRSGGLARRGLRRQELAPTVALIARANAILHPPITTVTVKSGDSLSAIASAHRLTLAALLAFPEDAKYRANPSLIHPGDIVRVKRLVPARLAPAEADHLSGRHPGRFRRDWWFCGGCGRARGSGRARRSGTWPPCARGPGSPPRAATGGHSTRSRWDAGISSAA